MPQRLQAPQRFLRRASLHDQLELSSSLVSRSCEVVDDRKMIDSTDMAGNECRISISFALDLVRVADEMGGRSKPDLFRCLACGQNVMPVEGPEPHFRHVTANPGCTGQLETDW